MHPDAKSADFRLAMREFASGVAIVTSANGKERSGCTATALASLSLTPPSLVICLERSSSTLAVLTQAGAFAVNILAAKRLSGRTNQSLAAKTFRLSGALGSVNLRV